MLETKIMLAATGRALSHVKVELKFLGARGLGLTVSSPTSQFNLTPAIAAEIADVDLALARDLSCVQKHGRGNPNTDRGVSGAMTQDLQDCNRLQ